MGNNVRKNGARVSWLVRPMAAGLVLLVGVAPSSFDVRAVVATPRDEFVTRSLATQATAVPAKAAHARTAQTELIEPANVRKLPVVLAVAGQPKPVPLLSPPLFARPRGPLPAQEVEAPALAEVVRPQPPDPTPASSRTVLALPPAEPPLRWVAPPSAPTFAAQPQPMRPVDIAQIDTGRSSSIRVPQLHEPGLVPGGPNLADKTAAMQVTLPPPARLSQQELALLQSEAPSQMTVRLGEDAVGQVAFRMSENRTIDVQLSGLLDVLAERFTPEDFARLRSATAADSFVPLDTLRAIGLGLHYDPVYDELRVSA